MSELLNKENEEKFLKLLPIYNTSRTDIYNTSRIDIKNFGKDDNSIEIIENSDSTAYIDFPKWFKNNQGSGVIIKSNKSSIDLKIKCINDGTLNIFLKGVDVRDKNNNRFPVYIDYTSLIINNKEQLKENKLIWHDEPLKIIRKVKDNELITIHVEWKPFSSSSLYENKKINDLEEKLEELKNEMNEKIKELEDLEEENENFKRKLNLISNSSLREFRKMKKEL